MVALGCGDDGTPEEDAGSDGAPLDTSVPVDSGGSDTLPADSATMDTGPDPRCPGPTCPTTIIALDGWEISKPCALRRDGELFCVDGDTPAGTAPVFTPAGSFAGGQEIARGESETCILFVSHIVSCFRPGMAPYEVPELYDALDIDTWADHTCVVRPDRLTCWGDNGFGQIEPGGSERYPTMHDVPGVTEATRVATSAEATCALLRDGTVECWGDDFGAEPTPIADITEGVEITAGEDHFCVTTSAGTVHCFGDAEAGTEAVVPDGIDDAEEAVAFHGETCVRHASGQVSCWGEAGVTGQTEVAPFEPITGLDDALLLTNHCALRSTGAVSCWTDRDTLVEATGL
jgi:hypothetical protein